MITYYFAFFKSVTLSSYLGSNLQFCKVHLFISLLWAHQSTNCSGLAIGISKRALYVMHCLSSVTNRQYLLLTTIPSITQQSLTKLHIIVSRSPSTKIVNIKFICQKHGVKMLRKTSPLKQLVILQNNLIEVITWWPSSKIAQINMIHPKNCSHGRRGQFPLSSFINAPCIFWEWLELKRIWRKWPLGKLLQMIRDTWFPTMWHIDKWRLRWACAASF